jgi:hypothetical protein
MKSNYYEKYLKYKEKYLELKNKLNLSGGAFPFQFGVSTKFTIMAKLGGDTLLRVNERRVALGLPPKLDLHITLWEIHVNLQNPDSEIFYDPRVIQLIIDSYNRNLKGTGVNLISNVPSPGIGGLWDLYGFGNDILNKNWARIYEVGPAFVANVQKFRADIYRSLSTLIPGGIQSIGTQSRGTPALPAKGAKPAKPADMDNFVIYQSRGIDLYAIHTPHYTGVQNWRPHISIFQIKELHTINPALIAQLNTLPTNQQKSDHIKSIIGKMRPISSISFGGAHKNVDELWISMRHDNLLSAKIGRPLVNPPIDIHHAV